MTIPNTNSCGHPFPQRPQPVRANGCLLVSPPNRPQTSGQLDDGETTGGGA